MSNPTPPIEKLGRLVLDLVDHLGDQLDPDLVECDVAADTVTMPGDVLRMLLRQASVATVDPIDEYPKARLRLLRVMFDMPFAHAIDNRPHRIEDITADGIADWLEALTVLLQDFGERYRAHEEELATVRRDVAGLRRLFGLEG